jgi:replicative DNA helicase
VKKGNARLLVHTPAELATSYVKLAESIQADPGIPFGIADVDRDVIPMRPGNLIVFTARPGHGKTSMMAYLAKQEAKRIQQRGMENHECVVYITWEQGAEELEAFFQSSRHYSVTDFAWGRVDLDTIRTQAIKRAAVPIWVIGHGIGRAGKGAPRMFPDTIMDAIESMNEDFGVRPTLLCFDYMQLIPIREAGQRVEQVTEAPARVKELAERIGAVAIVGAQARQEVDDRNEKIPGPRDAQWASAIHQTADKHFSLMRPILYYEPDQLIRIEGQAPLKITENLFILRMLKQRFAGGRHTWLLHFDPAYLTLEALELERHSYDPYPSD